MCRSVKQLFLFLYTREMLKVQKIHRHILIVQLRKGVGYRWYDDTLRESENQAKELLEIMNNFGKVAGYKINPHKLSAFLYIANKAQ